MVACWWSLLTALVLPNCFPIVLQVRPNPFVTDYEPCVVQCAPRSSHPRVSIYSYIPCRPSCMCKKGLCSEYYFSTHDTYSNQIAELYSHDMEQFWPKLEVGLGLGLELGLELRLGSHSLFVAVRLGTMWPSQVFVAKSCYAAVCS